MATAYFINASPTNTTITLNTGAQQTAAPLSVDPKTSVVKTQSWGAEVSAFPGRDVFVGSDKNNELLYSSDQSPVTHRYSIKSSVSTTLDLYFFMFEDAIVGEDQTGSSANITIERIETLAKKSA